MIAVRRFRKNPHLPVVIVPGHGRVHDVDILEGDQYQHFAPHLLHEIGVPETAPVFQSVPAAAAVPALHDALAIAARETVPVEEPAPVTTDPVQPAPPAADLASPSEPASTETTPFTTTQIESNSANAAPNDTLENTSAPVKNKGGRPRKAKPAPDA